MTLAQRASLPASVWPLLSRLRLAGVVGKLPPTLPFAPTITRMDPAGLLLAWQDTAELTPRSEPSMNPQHEQPLQATLESLALLVGGRLIGDGQTPITGAAPLGEALSGQITLVDHVDRLAAFAENPASAVVFPKSANKEPIANVRGIAVDDVHAAFAQIISHFRPQRTVASVGRHRLAMIAETARLSATADIHAGAIIGEDVSIGERSIVHSGAVVMAGSRIGQDTEIFPKAVLYPDTIVGDRCTVHAGAVLGAYGFGYSQQDGKHKLASQLGGVEVADEVEIGAGTTVDRGVYGPTRIGEGTKIDNLAQIAHNCQIGRHNLICSQVGIAGSTTTGDYVVMGGQAGVRDHVTIGSGARLGAMCGVSNDVPDGVAVLGVPAVPERMQKLRFAAVAKLPEMRKEFKLLRKQVAELQKLLDKASADRATQDDEQNLPTDRAA